MPQSSCIICGYSFSIAWLDDDAVSVRKLSWDSEFRVLFSKSPDGNGPRLSGVGLDLEMGAIWHRVPLSYSARWDDNGRHFSDMSKVRSVQLDQYTGQWFPLHARCYTLLEEFFYPAPVSVARLKELCRSCPEQHGRLNWGHDYGEIVQLQHNNPWDELDIATHQECALGDPLEIPELAKNLYAVQLDRLKKIKINRKRMLPKRMLPKRILPKRTYETVANYFTKFPREILGYIMTYLPTDDVKALSRTCKELNVHIPSELGPSFWFSRFQSPFEFDSIFEVHKFQGKLDWKSLYFKVVKTRSKSPGLENREYIWNIIRSPLSDLYSLRMDSGQKLQLPKKEKLRWKEVYGDLRQREGRSRPRDFRRGCKRFHTQSTFIPTIRQVIISAIFIGNASCITGLSFISDKGLEIGLGYRAAGDKLSQNITNQVINTSGIKGFIVALGSKGIQALQLIIDCGELSPWVGHSDGLLKTRRLANFKHIAALKAQFDGFKLVGLAVAENCSSGPSDTTTESLRDNALWFPDIPANHLRLNETSFASSRKPSSEFEPLCYTIFRDATNQRSLTKVSVYWKAGFIARINFHYSTGDIIGIGCQDINIDYCQLTSFTIDGASGEVIKQIKIGCFETEETWEAECGMLSSLKFTHLSLAQTKCSQISTNRGREKLFRYQHWQHVTAPAKAVAITPGTTITDNGEAPAHRLMALE